MLKVVVFDGGYGGEFFADELQTEFPVIEIIRVIDWRNAEKILSSPKDARKIAEISLKPYIGKVDLIIFANYLISITSLKYFRKKYQNQKFLGLNLKKPDTFVKRNTLILTTKAVAKTRKYHFFVFRIKKRQVKTLILDSWPTKIDDGELSKEEISTALNYYSKKTGFIPQEIVLACSQFNDIKGLLREVIGQNLKIYDSFQDTIRTASKLLNLRGGTGRKNK